MSAPELPEAAVEAGARAEWLGFDPLDSWEELSEDTRQGLRDAFERGTRAALPYIRRAVIEGLIAKLDSEIGSFASLLADEFDYGAAYGLSEEVDDLRRVRDWLRAELAEGGDGE